MVGAELMNRAQRAAFLETPRKAVIVPACLRYHPRPRCKAVAGPLACECRGCEPRCRVRQLTRLGTEHGFDVFLVPHESSVFAGEAGRQHSSATAPAWSASPACRTCSPAAGRPSGSGCRRSVSCSTTAAAGSTGTTRASPPRSTRPSSGVSSPSRSSRLRMVDRRRSVEVRRRRPHCHAPCLGRGPGSHMPRLPLLILVLLLASSLAGAATAADPRNVSLTAAHLEQVRDDPAQLLRLLPRDAERGRPPHPPHGHGHGRGPDRDRGRARYLGRSPHRRHVRESIFPGPGPGLGGLREPDALYLSRQGVVDGGIRARGRARNGLVLRDLRQDRCDQPVHPRTDPRCPERNGRHRVRLHRTPVEGQEIPGPGIGSRGRAERECERSPRPSPRPHCGRPQPDHGRHRRGRG